MSLSVGLHRLTLKLSVNPLIQFLYPNAAATLGGIARGNDRGIASQCGRLH